MLRIIVAIISLIWIFGCAAPSREITSLESKGITAPQPAATLGPTTTLTRQGNTYVVTIPGVAWTLQFAAGELEPIITKELPGWSYYLLIHKSIARGWKAKEKEDLAMAGKALIEAGEKLLNVLNVSF